MNKLFWATPKNNQYQWMQLNYSILTCLDSVLAMSVAVTESASISCINVSHVWNSDDGHDGLNPKQTQYKVIRFSCLFYYGRFMCSALNKIG